MPCSARDSANPSAAGITGESLARLVHGFILALATQTHDDTPCRAADRAARGWKPRVNPWESGRTVQTRLEEIDVTL